MPQITLVARLAAVPALNALTDAENNGDLFSAGLATEASPEVEVARWAKWDTMAYSKQSDRTKDEGTGGWELHKQLAAHPLIGAQIASQNGWGADNRMEFYANDKVQLLAYRNKNASYISDDIMAAFGVRLVPLEVPEP